MNDKEWGRKRLLPTIRFTLGYLPVGTEGSWKTWVIYASVEIRSRYHPTVSERRYHEDVVEHLSFIRDFLFVSIVCPPWHKHEL